MEISGTNLSTNSSINDGNAVNGKSTVAPVAQNAKDVAVPQDKVSISPEALNAQKQEQAHAAEPPKAATPAPATPPAAAKAATGAATPEAKEKPPAAQSFVYGALGLERPEKTEEKSTDGYTVGRWLAAGVTAGAIISILV